VKLSLKLAQCNEKSEGLNSSDGENSEVEIVEAKGWESRVDADELPLSPFLRLVSQLEVLFWLS
jgi:hypothetical protein